ncbi:MAG TPA: serine/threonine protein kinase [Spirochaetota bacterium]|nr:serine/threonine protein kinase [Spirochaetota bacterium]HPS87283.1 serine/threonine protein kinase [Spirochaetota bacterium]
MSTSFYNLTPDRVIEAVEKSGFSVTGHYMVLNSYENRVYDLKLENENHIIVKFYRPGRWSHEQIQEEHQFLLDLAADEIPVCAPLIFSDGATIHDSEGIFFAIWPRTGGRIPEELSNTDMINVGRLLGRIHNNGASKESRYRLKLTGESYGINSLKYLTENNFLPSNCIAKYSEAVNEIVRVYDSLITDVPFLRIHGDCHMGNLLKRDGAFFFLDFDDFLVGPAVQDIWMLISSRDANSQRELNLFLEGYREFRSFENSWLKLIEPLRGLRYIYYAAWIARRWSDPAFPQIFPHFGTDEYWNKETSDLEDQVKIIYANESIKNEFHPEAPEKEKELTNKDFFWDME